MCDVTALVHLDRDGSSARSATVEHIRELSILRSAGGLLVEPTLAGVRNGGHIVVRVHARESDSQDLLHSVRAALVSVDNVRHVDAVAYRPGRSGHRSGPSSIYRALLLRVDPGTEPNLVRDFEAGLLRMPRFVTSMTWWQLNRVDAAAGTSSWTHLWEQRFADLDGLTGQYLAHPVHWGHVDRWFDPESPDCIIREKVCHSYCEIAADALTFVDGTCDPARLAGAV